MIWFTEYITLCSRDESGMFYGVDKAAARPPSWGFVYEKKALMLILILYCHHHCCAAVLPPMSPSQHAS